MNSELLTNSISCTTSTWACPHAQMPISRQLILIQGLPDSLGLFCAVAWANKIVDAAHEEAPRILMLK